jgi:deazaflavin-dependent oxidoreductase (nitroreductase family)
LNNVQFRLRRLRRSLATSLYRRGFGRRLGHLPLILLTSRGTRTGKLHTVPVASFEDADCCSTASRLVVAAFAGAGRHPAWYHNLRRDPDHVWIEVGKRVCKVVPTCLEGADRSRAWQRLVSVAPNLEQYARRTNREIPVVRLTLVGAIGPDLRAMPR